jgi:hypothetical protein
MGVKHMLFTSVLTLASATYSPVSLSDEVETDANNKPTKFRLDSIPEVSVTCFRCEELARKYLSVRANAEVASQPRGIQSRISQEAEEEAE